jgi:predicted ATPase
MPFIYGISLKNFKVFNEKVHISFAPLTILTGTNSSGKSTVNHALMLLKRVFESQQASIKNFSHSDIKINFAGIIDRIPLKLLDKRTATFKNLTHKGTDNNIIEFSIPANIIDHDNPLDIEICYSIHPNELQPADLESLKLRDTTNDVKIFELYKKMRDDSNIDGYFCRINYSYFYKQFKEESKSYRSILNLLNDVWDAQANELKKSHQHYSELINLLVGLYGSILPELSGVPGKYNLEDPILKHEFIQDEFHEFRKSLEKEFRKLNIFPKENDSEVALFSFEYLIPDPHERFEFLSNFSDGHVDSEGFNTNCHTKILDYLSNHEFNIATYYGRKSTDVGISIGVNSAISCPDNALFDLCAKYFHLEDFISNVHKSAADNRIGNQRFNNQLLTKSGTKFFKEYIFRRIAQAINNSMSFRFINDNHSKVNLTESRLLDLTLNENGSSQILDFMNQFHEFSPSLKEFTNLWIKRFGIGEEINFNNHGAYTEILIKKNDKTFNLADEGLGISKLTPVIINVINIAHNNHDIQNLITGSTLLLEEPEAGLHPALQSQLAEFLFDAYKKFNIQFIIETHSEYLIRKLQTMVADTSNSMKPEDAIVYYFYHPDNVPEGSKQVVSINIQSDGSLSRNFGTGFFDESSNLNIALYKLTKASQN